VTIHRRAYVPIRRRGYCLAPALDGPQLALTFAAVTLRLGVPMALAAGFPFDRADPVIAWLLGAQPGAGASHVPAG
jgi:hypothetical protein